MTVKKIILSLATSALLALPLLAGAQLPPVPTVTVTNFCDIILLLEQVVWVVFTAIAVVSFVLAGILFLTSQGSPDKVSAARGAVLWGVVGIVVGILAYAIIQIVGSALGSASSC